jgi:hypothetical protein
VPQASKAETQASALTDECKHGANNVISQFNTDSDLKAIDTPTLVSVSGKLRECLDTKGLTDADSVLLLFAQNQANLVLLDRAVNVLDRHALLPEVRAERSPSRNTTVSHIPSGTGSEQ